MNHARTHVRAISPPSAPEFFCPFTKLEHPRRRYSHAADYVAEPHQQCEKVRPPLADDEQYRFNVIFEEDSRDMCLGNLGALRSGSILVCKDGFAIRITLRVSFVFKDTPKLVPFVHVWCHVKRCWLRDCSWIKTPRLCTDTSLGEDCWHDRDVILKLVEVGRRSVARSIEWIQKPGVVRTEGEFIDMMTEIEKTMVKVLRSTEFHVPMSTSCDVKVALDFISFETTVYSA